MCLPYSLRATHLLSRPADDCFQPKLLIPSSVKLSHCTLALLLHWQQDGACLMYKQYSCAGIHRNRYKEELIYDDKNLC